MFFQMTQIMTIMEDFLNMQGYKYLRLDGSTKAEDRTELLKKFNSPESDIFIFLLSTRAGGLGLNLQTADTVVIFDSDWNPHQDLQAQDRAHRIGQTNEVRIFRLITIESVEEYILERAQHKLNLDGKIIQAGKFDHKSTNEERDALLRTILEREAEKNDVEEIYDDDELNEIIARDDSELELFRQLDEKYEKIQQQRFEQTGIRLARLVETVELPKIYIRAAAEEDGKGGGMVEDDSSQNLTADSRTTRRRDITYNENISDSKWLAQLERSESPTSNNSSTGASSNGLLKRERRRKRHQYEAASTSESDSVTSPHKAPCLKFKIPRPPGFQEQKASVPTGKEGKKGKRTTSIIDNDDEDDGDGDGDGLDRDTRVKIMQSIYDTIENCVEEGETNRYRSDLFLELPDREMYPDYYSLVKSPICLSMIESRIPSQYKSLNAFMNDMALLFGNAISYNLEGSQVYEDAQAMRQLAIDRLAELLEAEGRFDNNDKDDGNKEKKKKANIGIIIHDNSSSNSDEADEDQDQDDEETCYSDKNYQGNNHTSTDEEDE